MSNYINSKFLNLKKISTLIETFQAFRLMNFHHLKDIYQKIKNIPDIWKISKSPLDKFRLILESINSLGHVLTVLRSPLEALIIHTKFKNFSKFLKWLPNHPLYISVFILITTALKVLEIYQNSRVSTHSNDQTIENTKAL